MLLKHKLASFYIFEPSWKKARYDWSIKDILTGLLGGVYIWEIVEEIHLDEQYVSWMRLLYLNPSFFHKRP